MSNQSKDTAAYKTISEIAANCIIRLKIDPKNEEWIIQTLIDIIRDLNMFHFKGMGTKPVLLKVDPDLNFVYFPNDYIDWVMIGTIINGQMKPFKYNSNIAIPLTVVCGVNENEYKNTLTNIADVQVYGEDLHRFSGVEFTIDKKGKRIIFHGRVHNNIVYLDYITTGISLSETTYVPVTWQTCLRNYIDWQNEQFKPDSKIKVFNLTNKERLYKNSAEVVRLFEQKITIAEAISEIRKGFSLTHRG
jgi:hypothetical protein